jgi:hypothetical protein
MGTFFAQYPASSAGSNASVGTNGAIAPTSSTEVAGINPSGDLQPLQTDASGNLNVSIVNEPGAPFHVIVDSSALPTGAATSANQTSQITQETTTATNTTSILANQTNGTQITTISGTVPLPTGASTLAAQTNVQSAPGTPQTTAITVQGNASGVALPISGTVTATVTGVATAANQTNGSQETQIVQGGNTASVTAASALKVDGSAVTQPVSASALPLPAGAATAANQTNGTQTTQINGGGNTATVTAANAVKVDGSAVTQPVSGTVTANAGTGNFTVVQSTASNLNATVTGTVTANAGTGSFTVAQATASNLNATIVGTTAAGSGASTNLVTIQGNASGTPVPISGTITASNPSVSATGSAVPADATMVGGTDGTNLRALSTTTTGQLNTQIQGGGNTATVTAASALKVDGSAVTQPVSGSGSFTTIGANGTLTDNSGTTSGTANTSTQIMASNSTRKYLVIQNVGTATIWINFTTAATTNQPSIELSQGASFSMDSNFVSTEAINVISATASVAYTAKQA